MANILANEVADGGVETNEGENEDGENNKVSAVIGQENWTRKMNQRYINNKDGLVAILFLSGWM